MRLVNCSADTFRDIINKRKWICFGATESTGKVAAEHFQGYIEEHILFFTDNDSNKWGKKLSVCGKEYEIRSPEILNSISTDNIGIFITSRFWDEIYQQLNTIDNLQNVLCFSYFLFPLIRSGENKCLIQTTDTPCIPKILHYCWFGRSEYPDDVCECLESWKKYAPDFEIILWNEDNYDINKNWFLQTAYKEQLWNCICDYARFDIIYNYGGIYLDTDVKMIQSFDQLCYNRSFWGRDPGGQAVNTGIGFGAVKHDHFVREHIQAYEHICEQCIPLKFKDGSWNLDVLAPLISTKIFSEHGLKLRDETEQIEDALIYSSEILSPALQIPTKNTRSIHRCGSTWSFSGQNMQEKWDRQKEFYENLVREGQISIEQ